MVKVNKFGYFLIFALLVALVLVRSLLFLEILSQRPEIKYELFETSNTLLKSTLCEKKKSTLFGIFTIASKKEFRNIIRQNTQCHFNSYSHATIFVLGMPSTFEDQSTLLNESLTHNDVLILPCKENMNEDKTFQFFKAALALFPCYEFYAKTDDDTAFHPTRIVDHIKNMTSNRSLYIGRKIDNYNKDLFSFVVKSVLFGFRDMNWLYEYESFFAGMLYILNKRAVEEWMELNSTQHYGDEDMVTSYYMTRINATYKNVDTHFHDNVNYSSLILFDHWRSPISSSSMAVHKCKSASDLKHALYQLCV
jgi:Galactosyltransferase